VIRTEKKTEVKGLFVLRKERMRSTTELPSSTRSADIAVIKSVEGQDINTT
jgi:hypothetical protein